MSYPSDYSEDEGACCTPAQLKQKLDEGADFILLDVRTAEELEYARIDQCLHIPLNELPERLHELEDWRDREIVTMCHHGMRSDMAHEFLTEHGFKQVRNLIGGIDAYAAEVDPAVGRY